MYLTWRHALAALAWAGAGWSAQAADLPQLNIDLKQTTVSGISSGAFMAVQMGVAKSASVRGVAVTAGGPYFCALQDAKGGLGVTTSIARCMQGDPALPAQPITDSQLQRMVSATRDWSRQGKIDPVSNLATQAVWVFHGYNDGIVKRPVSDALLKWYGHFTPDSQIFYKDTLNAAHAQISAACPAATAVGGTASSEGCNVCPTTGGKFINACADQPSSSPGALYDAAGSALQMFYGALTRTATDRLSAKAQEFSQAPYLKLRGGSAVTQPEDIAMGATGYVYVPQACREGQPCRLHIAFHGCMQSAATLGRAFVDGAGVNEWADANRIVVLYPQATPTQPSLLAATRPLNPMGCWDWWGYNDKPSYSFFDPYSWLAPEAGTYAMAEGLQVAAVWRMAEKLATKATADTAAPALSIPATELQALDHSDDQAMLRWRPVGGASSYRVYRSSANQAAQALGSAPVAQLFWADSGLQPQSSYRYTVRAVVGGHEGPDSNAVSVSTAGKPPTLASCDPYFSLSRNQPVKKSLYDPRGIPTTEVCP
jgi:poly(3-hydroxybutyrate) depolymerase